MHMADALISPSVGLTMTAVSIGLIGYCTRRVKKDMEDKSIPLMGVMGAFIFAAQMINFTIPATGSSGHIGGGLLLAAILGPYAAFLTIASVLVVQALFFADGGILAWGCNVFNMGFFPCFIGYPLVYRFFAGRQPSGRGLFFGALLGVVLSLQLGAFSVVLETLFSGRTELSFLQFLLLMQPIHLAIGTVEGLVTAGILAFLQQASPELLAGTSGKSRRGFIAGMLVLTLVTGGLLSLYASEDPDGLEWSIQAMTGTTELAAGEGAVHETFAAVQEKTAFLPDYAFKETDNSSDARGTSMAGIIGGGITLFLVGGLSKLLSMSRKKDTATANHMLNE